jgi:uncharacterized membrane protein YdjX (TVP38/TMEM64 family)
MKRKTLIRLLIGVVLVAAIVAVYLSPVRQQLQIDRIPVVAAQISAVWYGPLLFIAAYAIASVFFIPASFFVLSAGFIWGWKLGGPYAIVGGTLGAIASYWTARFLGGNALAKFGRRGEQLAAQMKQARLSTLLMFRFVPFPFPLVNYAAGAAEVPAGSFAAATFVGLIPSGFGFAYIGEVLRLVFGAANRDEVIQQLSLKLLAACACIGVLILIPRLIKKRAPIVEAVEE